MLATAQMELAHAVPLPARPAITSMRSAHNLAVDDDDTDDVAPGQFPVL